MKDYDVVLIKSSLAKEYIKKNHYSKGCHNGPSPCFGLFDGDKLIGVLMFATPCSEAVRSSVFGVDYKNHVIELHRLHIMDITPKNAESWFIAKCLKELKKVKPQIWGVLSFADLTEGHEGIIYKATNAYHLGFTCKSTFFLDKDGRLRHPRQNGANISKDYAEKLGWKPVKRDSKVRYLWLLPDCKSHKTKLKHLCKYEQVRR